MGIIATNINKSVLIVEDDKISALLIRELLRPLNLEIHIASDGKDAIDFLKLNPETNLILMDVKLPFMNGYEAVTEIRKINPDIPIIAQTAYAMMGDREKALNAGCNDYLTKPLDSKKLLSLVMTYLSK